MALFVFFLWQTLDNYVNNYKSALTRILERYRIHESTDPSMYSKIQSIGNNDKKDNEYKDKIIISYLSDKEPKSAVEDIFNQIKRFTTARQKFAFWGLLDIIFWMGLAIFYLIDIQFWNNKCPNLTQYRICSILFVIGVIGTISLLWSSFIKAGLPRYIKNEKY